MTAPSASEDPFEGYRRRRRGRLPRWVGSAALAAILIMLGLILFLRGPTIGERESERRIINVVLPPPPPPPTPPPTQPKPPEPKPAPISTPQPTPQTPPPPAPAQAPAQPQANDSLTARVGPGTNNFGLAAGNGSGTRIGGKPGGGDAFGAYANAMLGEIRRAAQNDPTLSRGLYTMTVAVQVAPDGRIATVRVLDGSGDARRDSALRRRLAGLQLSQRPPDGLPVMRIELDNRSGA